LRGKSTRSRKMWARPWVKNTQNPIVENRGGREKVQPVGKSLRSRHGKTTSNTRRRTEKGRGKEGETSDGHPGKEQQKNVLEAAKDLGTKKKTKRSGRKF